MRLGAQTGTPPGVCEKSAVNLRQAAFYRHSIGRNVYPAAAPMSFVLRLLLLMAETFSPFYTYLHIPFHRCCMKMVKKRHFSGMALIVWGAQPPRLLFGAPRAAHKRVGRPQWVGPFQASAWAARARRTAPEAGALPSPKCKPSGQDVIIQSQLCENI
jgi:hypothetical protein